MCDILSAGTMDTDACPFDVLPYELRDSILMQAFQQLDQQHLLTIVPLVCQLWHQLSLSTCTSLDVKLKSNTAAQQLAQWILQHGSALGRLSITAQPYPASVDQQLLQSLSSAAQLSSLMLDLAGNDDTCSVNLASLTKLTSLSILSARLSATTVSSLVSLTKLHELNLIGVEADADVDCSKLMKDLGSQLVKLTSIDLSSNNLFSWSDYCALKALPLLTQLHLRGVRILCHDLISSGRGLPIASARVRLDAADVTQFTAWLLVKMPGELQYLQLWDKEPTSEEAVVAKLVAAVKVAGPQFKSLGLYSFHNLNSYHMAEVAGLTQLTSLCLWGLRIDDAALCQLSSLSSLGMLYMYGSHSITGAGGSMQVLATHMPQLTRLVLSTKSCCDSARQAFGSRVVDVRCYELRLRPVAE